MNDTQTTDTPDTDATTDGGVPDILEPRLWRRNGWTAKVVKNSDDDGWAVEMTRSGASEPSLVGPWTMGRDKKNPKPLDQTAFHTLVKTAKEVIERAANAARARLHKSITYLDADERRLRVDLDIVPDEDDPHAFLSSFDDRSNEPLQKVRVSAGFKLSAASAERALKSGGDA
ncbi:MAG: hypothetical protein J0L92_09485 [Deltaproteobacteria bacterium]|nr:hypothetical protein [Deltaproteobacteria bacterium]